MALPKLYDLITWHNNTTPALNEDNLNAMSKGLDDVDDRLIALAGTIMEDVPQIIEDMEILGPAIATIDANVTRAETAADDAEADALKSEGYAAGTQDGVDVTSGEYYQNNAKYYAEIANPPIENTVGFTDVITISDAINKAAKDVHLKVEAVQDLHGYDNPWVGGAGKNILPMSVDSIKAAINAQYPSITWDGNSTTFYGITHTILTDDDGNVVGIKVNGTENAGGHRAALASFTAPTTTTYYLNGTPSGGGGNYLLYDNVGAWDTGSGASYSWSAGHNATIYLYIAGGATVNNVIFKPMLRTSGNDTFEPYTNICPIIGWDNAKVTREGKNLLENTAITETKSGITFAVDSNGVVSLSGVLTTQYITHRIHTDWVAPKSGDYIFGGCPSGAAINTYYMNIWNSRIDTKVYEQPITFTATKGEKFNFAIIVYNLNGATRVMKPMVTFADAPNSDYDHYEPYQGIETTISLGGTRYGGTLDVTSGVLTLDKVVVDIGTLTWNYGSGYFYASSPTDSADTRVGGIDCISDRYVAYKGTSFSEFQQINGAFMMNSRAGGNAKVIYIINSAYSDAATFKTAMSGSKIVYELATPQTIQLTPTQVYLLYGYNTLFGDCGDISLTYDASGIIHIEEAKLDTETLKTIAAASSDFADFKARIAAL